MSRAWVLRIAMLVAAVVVTFGGAVFTDRVFYERDILNYWGPHVEVFVRAVAEHALPLWNPYTGFGAPLLADPNFALAYPPTWLNLVVAPATYYKLLVVCHCAWAGLGVLLLARHRGLPPDASLVAASAYCLSGPFLSAASLFHHYTGAAWMPWVLLAFLRLWRAPSAGSALHLGVAGAMQILAGSGDLCLMTLLAGAFLALGLERPTTRPPLSVSTLRFGTLAVVLALGLAAVQWVPTGELLASGGRSQQGDQSLYWSLHPSSLPDVAALGVVSGLPLSAVARGRLYEGRDPLLRSIYWGPLTLVLALVGLVLPGPGRGGLAAGLAFFLIAALGRHTPIYPLLLHLPVLPLLRYPTKYLWGATLFAALLAGLGVSSWARPWGLVERRRAALVGAFVGLAALTALAYAAALHFRAPMISRWLEQDASTAARLDSPVTQAVVAALLLGTGGFAVYFRLTERAVPWSALAAVLLASDLARAGRDVNPLAPRALFLARPVLLDALKAGGTPRLYSAASRPHLPAEWPVRGPQNWRPEWIRTLGVIDRLIPPTPSRWGLFGSFDGDFTGLAGRSYAELTTLVHAVRDRVEGTALLRLCGVDYVVTLDPGVFGGSLPEAARADSVYASPVFLLSVPNAFPRVFVVDGIRTVAEVDALNVLIAGGVDPSREVLVSGNWQASPTRAGFRGSARLLSRRADSLSIEADLAGPGVLVVLEAYHPGWQAAVDGRPAPILRANALFRGVPLVAGHHRVEMFFRPPSAMWGAALSLVSLLGALALWAREARKPAGTLSNPNPSQ
jgi:hypothetical protein